MGPGTLASKGEREALKHKEEDLLRVIKSIEGKCAAKKGAKIRVDRSN